MTIGCRHTVENGIETIDESADRRVEEVENGPFGVEAILPEGCVREVDIEFSCLCITCSSDITGYSTEVDVKCNYTSASVRIRVVTIEWSLYSADVRCTRYSQHRCR